jgi:predicted dehydrogenase
MIMKNSRRDFVKASAAGAAGILAGGVLPGFTAKSYGRVIGANEKINVAVAGVHSRGGYYYGGTGHTANYTKIKDSRVIAICDVDESLFPIESAQIVKLGGDKPKTEVDYRKLLEDKDIDAVSIATPDYWHALHTIWACQAGKDVYVEKPLSWSLEEGRKMVEAARKYNRIVQIGTNYRANRITQKALKLLQDGIIGDIYMGRATVFGHRGNIGRVANSPVPQGVNWDLYRGPAPMIPFNTNHFHYNWHWYWDTATGEFGNNGTHYIDRIRAAMKKNEHPVKVSCSGGFYAYDSDQEVPNLQTATFEYADGKIMELEVRSLYTPLEEESIILFGTKGYALLGTESFKTFVKEPTQNLTKGDEQASKKLGKLQNTVITIADLEHDPVREEYEKNKIEYHFVNFLECVKSRKRENLLAEVEEGHLSTAFTHLGNIAYKTGRKLQFDSKAEKFIKDHEANELLSRAKYREPYVLPKKV